MQNLLKNKSFFTSRFSPHRSPRHRYIRPWRTADNHIARVVWVKGGQRQTSNITTVVRVANHDAVQLTRLLMHSPMCLDRPRPLHQYPNQGRTDNSCTGYRKVGPTYPDLPGLASEKGEKFAQSEKFAEKIIVFHAKSRTLAFLVL